MTYYNERYGSGIGNLDPLDMGDLDYEIGGTGEVEAASIAARAIELSLGQPAYAMESGNYYGDPRLQGAHPTYGERGQYLDFE